MDITSLTLINIAIFCHLTFLTVTVKKFFTDLDFNRLVPLAECMIGNSYITSIKEYIYTQSSSK